MSASACAGARNSAEEGLAAAEALLGLTVRLDAGSASNSAPLDDGCSSGHDDNESYTTEGESVTSNLKEMEEPFVGKISDVLNHRAPDYTAALAKNAPFLNGVFGSGFGRGIFNSMAAASSTPELGNAGMFHGPMSGLPSPPAQRKNAPLHWQAPVELLRNAASLPNACPNGAIPTPADISPSVLKEEMPMLGTTTPSPASASATATATAQPPPPKLVWVGAGKRRGGHSKGGMGGRVGSVSGISVYGISKQQSSNPTSPTLRQVQERRPPQACAPASDFTTSPPTPLDWRRQQAQQQHAHIMQVQQLRQQHYQQLQRLHWQQAQAQQQQARQQQERWMMPPCQPRIAQPMRGPQISGNGTANFMGDSTGSPPPLQPHNRNEWVSLNPTFNVSLTTQALCSSSTAAPEAVGEPGAVASPAHTSASIHRATADSLMTGVAAKGGVVSPGGSAGPPILSPLPLEVQQSSE